MAALAAELLRATEPRVIATAAAEIRRLRIVMDLSKVGMANDASFRQASFADSGPFLSSFQRQGTGG
jgi:hypothetical protein